jgi:hypothetical protein
VNSLYFRLDSQGATHLESWEDRLAIGAVSSDEQILLSSWSHDCLLKTGNAVERWSGCHHHWKR